MTFHSYFQSDITEAVMAQKQLQKAMDLLADEKLRTNVLLQRQHELIACLSKIDNAVSSSEKAQFGKVYKGTWRGSTVAMKVMAMSDKMSDSEKRERMALMETAISSSLSHPSIIQTYTFSMKPIMISTRSGSQMSSGSPATSSGDLHILKDFSGFEVQVVLLDEYCDLGSLRSRLDLFSGMQYKQMLKTVLELGSEVARGMVHLHSLNILHSDLKAVNILLQNNPSKPCGFIAKVSDFGLSVKMDLAMTHISDLSIGTLTHMAPEVILNGHQSKASDV
ncbi:hypothetical protein CEUSTIGMA_g8247.t1 [Chlamydomonas eustigma]|uniref:Protein kinase domain-containing protein n=1 Tax=Chlamydomonas eustigma TaxID=1157962 RepID=A0A250XCL0_9CHLO|nr:hypothetical protein CEUSTIGMA_g8247.t1 [Chlamydomonas eustigma]|eukprot:GAX80811.1 hypothetical protein CEUSTIGMA_g8247.t1 [Chlamydomonas eustigma]